ncbi:hypothetical protein Sjap_013683 [Stephania japonica]|uniref:Uncharacterized protein n=1 Tax=Stephania japonica TaxID=461633 RepID=A0AAP0J0W7_9MAGN
MLILSHQAIGGFLTHCGWNSTFEALGAGVSKITWPLFGEQFLNEKVIVDVLKVGYRVGVDVYVEWGQEERFEVVVKREEIERGVRKLMDKSEEHEEMRIRAKEIGEMGRRAMESGGSSHLNLSHFIQDIGICRSCTCLFFMILPRRHCHSCLLNVNYVLINGNA